MRALVSALAVLVLSAPALAQERPVEETEEAGGISVTDEERRYDALVQRFQNDYLRFTALLQVVPTVAFEDVEGNQPGFDVAAAWLGIGGRLDGGIGYFLRGDFARSPSLLEAYVSYGSDDVRGVVGRQKVPFSAEFLIGAANIDFVNRARIVREVAPGRAVGAQLRAAPGGGPLSVRAGVFNATQTTGSSGNRSGAFSQRQRGGALLAGRVQGEIAVGDGTAVVGANVAYNTEDTSDEIESPGRLDLGVDVRVRVGRVLLAGEVLRSRLDEPPFTALEPSGLDGGYATLGVDVTPDDRLLARLDVIAVKGAEASTELLLGYNRTLTRAASVQANVVVPLSDAGNSFDEPLQALLNFQLAF
ncbi:porin [Rubrivirga sp.]|uniref:porin n=1 Tax=Rubrivirga sp. TaxID=1885344 RepID=UPI003B51D62C